MRRLLPIGSVGLLAIGVVLTTLAVGQMLDGLREIPQHWWAARTPAPAVQTPSRTVRYVVLAAPNRLITPGRSGSPVSRWWP